MTKNLLTLALLPLTLCGGLPIPDHLIYGTIAIENRPATRARTDVVIEARRAANGPVIASYRMGSAARLGDFFYELRVELEESPRSSDAMAEPGETLLITVSDARGVQYRVTHRLTEPGAALRLDFGASVDTDGDGVPEGWELANLGVSNPDLNRDSDGDGALDRDEYTAGTHPLDAQDVFRLAVQSGDTHDLRVSFRALSALGVGFEGRRRYYALESRTNLMTGTWQPVENYSRIPGANQFIEFVQPADLTNAPPFFRARVWLEGP